MYSVTRYEIKNLANLEDICKIMTPLKVLIYIYVCVCSFIYICMYVFMQMSNEQGWKAARFSQLRIPHAACFGWRLAALCSCVTELQVPCPSAVLRAHKEIFTRI